MGTSQANSNLFFLILNFLKIQFLIGDGGAICISTVLSVLTLLCLYGVAGYGFGDFQSSGESDIGITLVYVNT